MGHIIVEKNLAIFVYQTRTFGFTRGRDSSNREKSQINNNEGQQVRVETAKLRIA